MSQKKSTVYRCFDVTLVGAIIVIVWVLMFLPVVLYFVLQPKGTNSQVFVNLSYTHQISKWTTNDSAHSVCSDDFFADAVNDTINCKPKCNSWMMYSQSAELASYVLIGTTTAIGILTTIVIIIMSFVCFTNMLEFPSVLVLYQDVIVSLHGVSVLIGFGDRRLFCTSDDLVETYNSSGSPYCTFSGIISDYMALPLTTWITIQLSYTILGVYTPMYFKQLKEKKWKKHVVHFASVLAGIISYLFPSILTVGLGGYSPLDTKFPPVVCFARYRDHTVYIYLIPLGILMATIITELILIFRFLVINSCTKKANKDFRKAEAKVIIICCCYIILGLAASVAYATSSANVNELKRELLDYFECERVRDVLVSDQLCDRSGYERFLNIGPKILGYSLLALYPVITLIYFFRKKKKTELRPRLTGRGISSRSFTTTL